MTDRHHRIDYIEFSVRDIARAKAFFGAVFGWEFTDYGPAYSGISGGEGQPEQGGLAQSAEVNAGGPLVVLYSKDIDATCEAVTKHGGTITKETFEFPGGRRFEFRDTEGNELAVWTQGPAAHA